MMLREVVSWMPLAPFSAKEMAGITPEHLTRTEPTVMMLPFGNSYAFACQALKRDLHLGIEAKCKCSNVFILASLVISCSAVGGIAELCQKSSSVPGEVPARHIQSKDGMRQAYPSTINHKMPVVRPDA
jgi:hypothetical protein